MPYRAIISYSAGAVCVPLTGQTFDHTDAESAKASAAKYLVANKTAFQNGYDALIIDTSTRKVVSSATVPVPTLDWQDTK